MSKKTLSFFHNKFSLLDIHTQEVVRKSSASLIVKIGGLAAGFIISIILGQTIGPEGLGIINLSNRIVSIVLILSLLGMNNVILKEIAIAYQRKDWQHVADSIFTSLWLNLPIALVLSLFFILIAPWASLHIFNDPDLTVPLIIVLAVVVPQVFTQIHASAINGFRKIWQSNLVNETLSLLVTASGLVLLTLLNIEITIINVAVIYAASRLTVTLTVSLYWHRLFRFTGKRSLQIRPMLIVGLPLMIVSATTLIANNADIVMIGWLSTTREVGFYSVASKLGLLTSFFHLLTASALAPKIASLNSENKKKEMQTMVQQITKGLIIIGIISLIIFAAAGNYILRIWGDSFTVAYWPLIVISAGQFFNISTGVTGIILIMTGYEKLVGYVTLSSALINIALNLILIPSYGALGAAIATASTVTVENVIKFFIVKSKVGILTIPGLTK
jgi:O-antigen/teichoic acid export membrane protein